MAEKKAAPAVEEEAFPGVKQEVVNYLSMAEEEKRMFEPDFREAYGFMMPYRVKPGFDQVTRPMNASENFTTLGEEVATDFASDMADTFTPEHSQWAGIEVAKSVQEDLQEEVKERVKHETDVVFDALSASNFHEACKQGNKDLAVSAFGLAIEDSPPGEPFHCQVIPLTELFILRAARGGIGIRFWRRMMRADQIKATFPHLQMPRIVQDALNGSPKKGAKPRFRVVQGCYRDYAVPAELAWISFTMIHDTVAESSRSVGMGSASILVCRWDPDPCFAWGSGPGIKALADFRQLDEVTYLKLKGMARIVDPSFGYTDDSVINLEGGMPNGVAIPMLQGSTIEVIESKHSIDAAVFGVQEVVDRIRRIFYLDEPKQPGKTPPTLGQWMDESLRRQRRLGTPAAPLWPEFLAEAFMRFRYLLAQQGVLEADGLKLPVGKQILPIRPMNPLKRAAQQEEAAASERALSTISGLFGPQLLPRIVDVGETVTKLVDLSHATGVKLKSVKDINAGLDQMMQAEMAAQAAKAAGPVMGAMKGGA